MGETYHHSNIKWTNSDEIIIDNYANLKHYERLSSTHNVIGADPVYDYMGKQI